MAQTAKSANGAAKRRRGKGFVIDVHTHIRVPELIEYMRKNPPKSIGAGGEDWFSGRSMANLAGKDKERWPKLTDPKVRLREMDRTGVDIQVVSNNFPVSCYWIDGRKGLQAARHANDGAAEFAAADPDRFVGLASLPMQAPKLAAGELERAVTKLGLRGAWIASNVRGKDLGERQFWPVWEKAQELDVPIFVHPLGTTDVSRLRKFFLWNTIGQPLEEAMAMASLIHEGALDAYPRLKMVICHGGGYLPYYPGRFDHAFETHAETRENIRKPPSAYMKRFHYDSIIFDHDMLRSLVKRAGANRIMLGSDWPLVLDDAVDFVRKARGLSAAAKDQIMWKNAARLLKIPV